MNLFMCVTVLDVVIALVYGESIYQCPNKLFGLVRYCNGQRDYGSCIMSCWGPDIISQVDKLACPQGQVAATQYCDRRPDKRACYDTCILNPQQDVVCPSLNTVRSVVKYCTRRKDVQSCVKKCIIPGWSNITSPKPIDCPTDPAEVPQYCSQQTNSTACTLSCSPSGRRIKPEEPINCPSKKDVLTVMDYCNDRASRSACYIKCATPGPTGLEEPIDCPLEKNIITMLEYCNNRTNPMACYIKCSSPNRAFSLEERIGCPTEKDSLTVIQYCLNQTNPLDCLRKCRPIGQRVESKTGVNPPRSPLVIASRSGPSRRKISGPWSQEPINCPTDRNYATVEKYCDGKARQPACYAECWTAGRTVKPSEERLDCPIMQQVVVEYCRNQSDTDNCLAECIKQRAPDNLGEIVCPNATDNFSVLAHCSWWGSFESHCLNTCLPYQSHALMAHGKFDCPPRYKPLEVFVYCMRHVDDLHDPCLLACPILFVGERLPY